MFPGDAGFCCWSFLLFSSGLRVTNCLVPIMRSALVFVDCLCVTNWLLCGAISVRSTCLVVALMGCPCSYGVDWYAGIIDMIWSLGVVWSAGLIEISCCSFSWCCLFCDFVVRLMILSIFRFMCSLFLFFFFAGVIINAVGSLDVYMATGLPCEELEARLIIPIDLFEWNCDVSSWTLDEWESWRCLNFALSNFVCASAASLDFFQIRLFTFRAVLLVAFSSFAVVVFACLILVAPVGARVLVRLDFVVCWRCPGFRVSPVGLDVLGLCMLLFTAVLVWPVSLLITEIVLFFLGFYCIRVLSYMLQFALVLVWIQFRFPNPFFLITAFFLLFVSSVIVVGE